MMDKLIDEIAYLIDGRHEERLHITAEVARFMIQELISEYVSNFLKEELPSLITQKVCHKHGITDYQSGDCDFSEFVEQALREIASEKFLHFKKVK